MWRLNRPPPSRSINPPAIAMVIALVAVRRSTSVLRDLANGQRTSAAWRFVSSISDGTQHGQFDGAE
jgi:hypothetical protein